MLRKTVKSGTVWEYRVGYSGAIRVGSDIYVSGTTATDNVTGTVVGYKMHMHKQSKHWDTLIKH